MSGELAALGAHAFEDVEGVGLREGDSLDADRLDAQAEGGGGLGLDEGEHLGLDGGESDLGGVGRDEAREVVAA